MFKWFDELKNESQCYFLKKEDCKLDAEDWKRVGYKPIGSEIRYESVTTQRRNTRLPLMLVYEQPDWRFE